MKSINFLVCNPHRILWLYKAKFLKLNFDFKKNNFINLFWLSYGFCIEGYMIIFLCVIMFSWAICGCGSGYEVSIFGSISEMQEEFFVGQSQGIKASLVVGYREKEYIKDGHSGETIPFAILSFERVEKGELLPSECNLLSGNETYLGSLQKNPYTGALQVDLGRVYIGDTMVAGIVVDGKTIDIALLPLFDSV